GRTWLEYRIDRALGAEFTGVGMRPGGVEIEGGALDTDGHSITSGNGLVGDNQVTGAHLHHKRKIEIRGRAVSRGQPADLAYLIAISNLRSRCIRFIACNANTA